MAFVVVAFCGCGFLGCGFESCSSMFYVICQTREKTKSGACATHLSAPRFKINAVFKNCKFSKRARNTY